MKMRTASPKALLFPGEEMRPVQGRCRADGCRAQLDFLGAAARVGREELWGWVPCEWGNV